jgi:hypothetical protein
MKPNSYFEGVRAKAVREIEDRHGIKVIVADVPAPFTGDLDGVSIVIDYALPPDESLFITVHLFGHSVQWNTDAAARAKAGGARAILPWLHFFHQHEYPELAERASGNDYYTEDDLADIARRDVTVRPAEANLEDVFVTIARKRQRELAEAT